MVPGGDEPPDVAESDVQPDGVDFDSGRGLTPEEDDDLRRLHYLSTMAALSPRSQERLIQLRLDDRRQEIREPRELNEQ